MGLTSGAFEQLFRAGGQKSKNANARGVALGIALGVARGDVEVTN